MSRLLRDAGEALYGSRWQTEISKAIGVSDRTIRRWIAGVDDMPAGVAMDLWRIAEEHRLRLDDIIDRLKEASTPVA